MSGLSTTVVKAIQILQLLAASPDGLNIAECARDLEYSKSTTHRLLQTLTKTGFVRRDAHTRKYLIGPRLFELARSYAPKFDFAGTVEVKLRELVGVTGETLNLAIIDDGKCLYIRTVEGTHSVRMIGRVGARDPMHSTGVGKAMLAALPASELEEFLRSGPFPSRTKHTITQPAALLNHLAGIRRRGYSIDIEENEDGCSCVAAAIRNQLGYPIAAISISGPSSRFTEEKIGELGVLVVDAARAIEEELPPDNYRPNASLIGWSPAFPPEAPDA